MEHALKGDSPIFSLSRTCLHIPLTLSLSLMSLSSSYILSFYFQTPSHISPISSACLAQRHTNILRHAWKHACNLLMTCYPSERDWLFPWQWPPSLFVQLTRTHTDRVTQTGRRTDTLSPHQGTVLIPSCQQQGRGETRKGRGLIHSFRP